MINKIDLFFVFCAGFLAKICFCDCLLAWLFPFLMFWLLLKASAFKTKKTCFWQGYVFGLGFFGSSFYWVHQSFSCVGLSFLGIIANILLILYLALFSGASLWLTAFISQRPNTLRNVFFACSWCLFEFIRGILFTGFPWNLISYSTYHLPFFKQIANLIGAYGVSLLFMLIICLALIKKAWKYSGTLGLLAMAYGGYIEIFQKDDPIDTDIEIQLIQPAIKQENKLNKSMFINNLNCHLILSSMPASPSAKKKIVIWPEAAINTFLDDFVLKYISSHVNSENTFLLIGADRQISDQEIYNSAFLINGSGEILATYDKKHLLPFGEFIPELLLKIGFQKITAGMVNFSNGKKRRLIKEQDIPKFGVIICYEAAFPGTIVEKQDRPKWLINITNDAWFAGSDELFQHLVTTSFRAIEEGIPIYRSANTGISCVIDRKGSILKRLNEGTVETIKFPLSLPEKKTLFSRCGNQLFIVFLFLLLFSCLAYKNRYGRKNNLRFFKSF